MSLLTALDDTDTLLHGDFHTGNVFLQQGEPLLIDMDRLATGHPIIEISDLYYFYVILGEDDCPCGRNGKYFKINGRLKNAEIRGCSDTYAAKFK